MLFVLTRSKNEVDGTPYDNSVAESFFQLLNRVRTKKEIYGTREETHSDIKTTSKIDITVIVGMARVNKCTDLI